MRGLRLACVLLLSLAARAQTAVTDPANKLPANDVPATPVSSAAPSSFELPRATGDCDSLRDAACSIKAEAGSGVSFATPAETNKNRRVLDRKFIFLQSLSTLAMVADIESTAHALEGKSGAAELNPLFGQHPTRARMYGIGAPVNALTLFLSYRAKKIAPTRRLWELAPALTMAIHAGAAANNILASHP